MADSDKPRRGRGRGWGRGRAPAAARGTDPVTQARRPGGDAPAQPQEMPPPVDVHPQQGGGRRTHRGVPREDVPVPNVLQMQDEQLVQSMKCMDIDSSGGSSGRGRSRPPEESTRPKHVSDKRGTSGEKINLVANFFELLSRPRWAVFQYHVDFAPLVESSKLRHSLIYEHKETLGACFLFDGMSDLKTMKKMDEGTELFSMRRTDNERIRISLKFVTELAPNHPELQRLFNTQMRRNLRHLKYQLLGRHYFDQEAINEIPQHNLQIWQGVITSIRTQEEKLMMSVDTTHKVVRKQTALEVITAVCRENRNTFKEDIARELIGNVVMTRYNNRTYSVEDVDYTLNPTKTFELRDGTSTYVEYYKKQYDITIHDLRQPLLLCKSKERVIKEGASSAKKVYLVPELCCMTGLTDSMRNNFTMMREMAAHTRLDPGQRVRNLQIFINRVSSNENVRKEMSSWDLEFSKQLIQFQGRILPPEKIRLNSVTQYDQKSGDFSREMRGKHMFVPCHLTDWVIICTKYDELKANDFLSNLYKVCGPMGMNVSKPRIFVLKDDKIPTYLQAFRENLEVKTQLVCCIVNNNKKERYDAIKKTACLENAIPSQVIVARTLSKKQMLMSVATKIGIQLNCKLGGEPWAVEIPFKLKIMVIGFDTYHDSARRGRSAGAFVASMNQNLTRWYSKVNFHPAGAWAEISSYIQQNFTGAVKRYHAINGFLPELILYYRDGVGDGQIGYVRDWEVNICKNEIKRLFGERSPKFAFIVVNKKINARFFAPSGNGYSNPPPGTLVDHTVTRFDRYDFYLVSQCVRQGTVAPTMYNVIEDFSNLKPEYLQRISYKLTHLYFNWPGTIRVPAPCQYAHKLAFLSGQSLHQEPKEELCDTLFYL